ncbi:MAG: hypothetical protein JWN03_4139 [Nocardia sp.]|uniref:hypothetical protein n=1 Tax=Nocardia sp. TaxID=1821 RepID=UPI00260F635C|nr:hypothetical protein [Nocardia sp.]MCU1643864.1 hypothetical protein [Nocardia sp.]
MLSRIARLRALIDHPATGAEERAAAQRMLDRILAKSVRVAADERIYGARYNRAARHADLSEVADLIRADIAFARVVFTEPARPGEPAVTDPIRDAAAGIGYVVAALPGESSIVITIEDVPQDWGWDSAGLVSPALQALAEELADIMNSYNHDGPAIGKRFFGRVRVRDVSLVW